MSEREAPLGLRAISAVRWTGASTLAISLLQVVQLAVLSRLLAPKDFGLMAMVSIVVGFAQTFADMGITNAVIQRQDATVEELSSLYWLNVVSGLVVCLALAGSAPMAAMFFHEPQLRRILPWSAGLFAITPVGMQYQALLQRDLEFATLARIETAAGLAGVSASIATAVTGAGVYALIWGQLVGAIVRAGLALGSARPGARPRWHFRMADLRRFWRFGLFQMGEQIVNFVTSSLDRLLVGRLLGAEALGFYGVAAQIVYKPRAVINPILTRVAFPVFSAVHEDNPRLVRGYLKMTEAIALLNLPIYAGIAAVAGPLVDVLLGPRWAPAAPVVVALACLGIVRSLGNPIGSLILAKGRADLGFWMNVGSFAISLGAMIAGARWGTLGIADATLAVGVFNFVAIQFPVRWHLVRMTALDYLRAVAPYLACAALMAAVLWAIGPWIGGPPQVRLMVGVGLGAAVYGAGILASKGRSVRTFVRAALGAAGT